MEHFKLSLARFGAAVSALGSIVWLLWPQSGWSPNPEPLVASFTAITLWLSAELFTLWQDFNPTRTAEKKDDAELFRRMSEVIGHNEIYALRNQDLRSSFSGDDWEFTVEFFRFAESELEKFHDQAIQRAYNRFKIAFRKFVANFGTYVTLENGMYSWKSPEVRLPRDLYEQKMNEGNALNIEADELADRWQELHNLAKKKLAGY